MSRGEPHRTRRPRELSEEEHALWRGVARSVKPLRSRGAREPDNEPVAPPAAPHPPGHPKGITKDSPKAKPKEKSSKDKPTKPAPPLAPLGRRDKQKLARGSAEIEARIDLHGLTQAEAHAALARFLRRAQHDGARFVLVITGKGARPGDHASERGVLRRQVPLWLRLPDFRDTVVGFEEAHATHGGEGALYVRLRRARF
jgi:DNA-nicking Smr family endonuclease